MPRPGPDPSVTDVEIVRVIVAAETPTLGTRDIADEFDISRQAMERHLRRMVDEGSLKTGKTGGANIWWPTDEGTALLYEDSSTQ